MASTILLKNVILKGEKKDILISGGIISRIIPSAPTGELFSRADLSTLLGPGTQVHDCGWKTAMPGFINMHTHAAMSLMRGMEEDVEFHRWIENIWKIEERIDEEYTYWGTKVAALEMAKTGTTTYNDQYWFPQTARTAAVEMGLRPALAYVLLDKSDPSETSRQKELCEKLYEQSLSWDGASSIMCATFHAVYSVSEELIVWSAEFARKHSLPLHFHLSETRREVEDCKKAHGGLSPVQYLDRLGILDDRCIAAHSLWLSEEDVRILGERGVNCVHCINSNAKLSSGYRFLLKELVDAGANVCLGTDGCASSNNLDILEAMKTSALFQKAWRDDPTALPLSQLLDMATVNGARALGLNSGRIEEGKNADILLVDTDSTFFLSPGSFEANLVYSAHSDCIDSVMVGGKWVMQGRKVPGEKDILSSAREVLHKIGQRH